MKIDELIKNFEIMVDGLYMPSERDAPFIPVKYSDNLDQIIKNLKGNKKMVVVNLDDFFINLITEEDWHNELNKIRVKRFRKLKEFILKELKNPMVYRFGEIDIDVYILGKTEDNFYAGLSTIVTET